jgi:hypothetical protein
MLADVGLVKENTPTQPPAQETTGQSHQVEQKLRHTNAKLFDPCQDLVYPIEEKYGQVDIEARP